jgi:ssDNA-binding Zn-finger/Zn-ribbon topoisomerase 1
MNKKVKCPKCKADMKLASSSKFTQKYICPKCKYEKVKKAVDEMFGGRVYEDSDFTWFVRI